MRRFAKMTASLPSKQQPSPSPSSQTYSLLRFPLQNSETTVGGPKRSSNIDLQACRTRESSIIKPNSSPNQICSSRQRVPKKQSIRRSTQDSRHGISPKAMDLIEKVLVLPDVKEEFCKELDKWAISEGKFPIAYVKQAMQVFEREKNWSRIIQVSEWLVQKEEGKTLRTFEVFLKALDMHQRIDEAEAVWKNDILKNSWSIPTRLVTYVLAMFERHHKPIEVIKLFTKMADSGRNMDKKSIKRVARAYEQEGFLEMKTQMLLKYNLPVKDEQESVEDYKASQS